MDAKTVWLNPSPALIFLILAFVYAGGSAIFVAKWVLSCLSPRVYSRASFADFRSSSSKLSSFTISFLVAMILAPVQFVLTPALLYPRYCQDSISSKPSSRKLFLAQDNQDRLL